MTYIPVFQVEVPEDCATVVDFSYDPAAPAGRAVACLTAVMNDSTPFGEELARTGDELLARAVDIFLKAGVKLVCVEAMEGTRGRPEAMGVKVQERLRRGGARVVGVDDLGLESEMTQVWVEAQSSETRYGRLFAEVLGCIERRAAQLASPALATFLRLRREYETGKTSVGVLLEELSELEEATGCHLPADIRKPLIAIRREAEVDITAANAEQQELIARLKQNASEGVLDPDRVTTFRKKLEAGTPPSATELAVREYTRPTPPQEYSPLPLAPHEAAALEHFRLRLGIDEGMSIGFAGSGPEVEAYQSRHLKDKYTRESCDMAQMLGVGLNAYPNFCKFVESRQVLQGLDRGEMLRVVAQAATKAFPHFEARAFRGPEEREILSCLTRWGLLKKLASLRLTPEDYDQLVELLDEAFLGVILESLRSAGTAFPPDVLTAARRFDERRDFFVSFYDNARRRASGMALGTLREMERAGVGKALLACLGFHLPTVKATLASEQVPFWVLYPIAKGSGSAQESS